MIPRWNCGLLRKVSEEKNKGTSQHAGARLAEAARASLASWTCTIPVRGDARMNNICHTHPKPPKKFYATSNRLSVELFYPYKLKVINPLCVLDQNIRLVC